MVKWWRLSDSDSKNQCWIGLSPTGPVITGSAFSCSTAVVLAASSATVGWRKMSFELTRNPALAARATTWMLRIESPPSEKKSSCAPTRSTPRTSAQIPASAC